MKLIDVASMSKQRCGSLLEHLRSPQHCKLSARQNFLFLRARTSMETSLLKSNLLLRHIYCEFLPKLNFCHLHKSSPILDVTDLNKKPKHTSETPIGSTAS